MEPLKVDRDMRQTVRDRVMDRANALALRVLCALFAVMSLATPLGTGELFAAQSHVHERQDGEVRLGDLPLRVALPTGASQAVETVERARDATLASVTVDDAPDATAARAAIGSGEIGEAAAAALTAHVGAGLRTGFNARAPPRA